MKKNSTYYYAIILLSIFTLFIFEPSCSALAASKKDPCYTRQWGLHNTGKAVSASLPSKKGVDTGYERAAADPSLVGTREVIVAILDGPVDGAHPDLAESLWRNPYETADDNLDNDDNGFADDIHGWDFVNDCPLAFLPQEGKLTKKQQNAYAHGTKAAGIIAAQANNDIGIAGIASGAPVRLMLLTVLDGEGNGDLSNLLSAIRYAEENGASICSLSLGTETKSKALSKAISKSSMLFVCAAGNEGQNADRNPCYPAAFSYDNILSVGNMTPAGKRQSTSNYGKKTVDLFAPGTQIISTAPGGTGYGTGTSYAAPFAAGAAAWVYSYYDNISPLEVRDLLVETAQPRSALKGKCVSGGSLQLYRALTAYEKDAFSPFDYFTPD